MWVVVCSVKDSKKATHITTVVSVVGRLFGFGILGCSFVFLSRGAVIHDRNRFGQDRQLREVKRIDRHILGVVLTAKNYDLDSANVVENVIIDSRFRVHRHCL